MNIATADRLLMYRKKHNLSQEELAAKIGVSRQAVSKWERAEASPDTDNLILLSQIYGVTLDELLKSEPGENITEDAESEKPADSSQSEISQPDGSTESKVSKTDRVGSFLNKFPFYIIAVIAFLLWGVSGRCFGWGLSWICFLTVPLYYSLADAIGKRNPNHFAYPVLAAAVYILFGYFGICGGWAMGWIVFLTIPLYYGICALFKNDSKSDDEDKDNDDED